jgi:hypothetical protein
VTVNGQHACQLSTFGVTVRNWCWGSTLRQEEDFLRAWHARADFEGRSLVRTWLYRIATNACLNALERTPRRVMPQDLSPQ